MELINTSHITRHSDKATAHVLINLLRSKVETTLKYGYSEIVRESGVTYYSKGKTAFVDIVESIKAIKDTQENPYFRCKDFDYQKYINILELILVDRKAYGDRVPDTTDVWKELYSVVYVEKKPRSTRIKRVANKKASRIEFLEKFSKTKIIWG